MAAHALESLAGVGPATAQALAAAGYTDRQSIASATVQQLSAVKGFAEARATALIDSARTGEPSESPPELERAAATDPKRPKPGRKKRQKRKKLRRQHADLKKRSKKAHKKSKTASSKKKRKRWAAEADRLAKKARKVQKRLAQLG